MTGKYAVQRGTRIRALPSWLIPLSFFCIEVFCFFLLAGEEALSPNHFWPLAFGAGWMLILSGLILQLPEKAARVVYGVVYFLSAGYAVVQTGYYVMFSQMMWLSDFRYASEGADYADVLLSYPMSWWLGTLGLFLLGGIVLFRFPRWSRRPLKRMAFGLMAVLGVAALLLLPEAVFRHDKSIRYAGSDYGRAQSAEAAYTNLFNAHRLYQVCGIYQTLAKDVYHHGIYPLTPAYQAEQEAGIRQVEEAFGEKNAPQENAMTGLLKGKNVVLVLMESMDDWMIGEHTPTLCRLMGEGVQFTSFYTPGYGGIRTFNTEFCINTGSFLSSQGGYAFDYVTNHYNQSLASVLTKEGYSAKTFHYNDPVFYSRGEFSPAMGYDAYVSYPDYLGDLEEKEKKNRLYDDCLLFDNGELCAEFFREGQPTLNFVITRSAHLSYKYNEVLSHWGLKKYPEYRGLTGNEETDCAYLKAKLVDDFFARMLQELEQQGRLQDTVIIGVTDHYTYGYKDMASLYALSGTDHSLLLEKTPCFIWSAGMEPMTVTKTLNTADLLPTMLNLLGVEQTYDYIGEDAFDERYDGFVPFSNGSWITGDIIYDASAKKLFSISGEPISVSEEFRKEMDARVQQFIKINNLILDTDYYQADNARG